MLANITATLYNAHFRSEKDVQWIAADFLGESDRDERQRAFTRQTLTDQFDLMRTRARLAQMKPNDPKEDIPVWARTD